MRRLVQRPVGFARASYGYSGGGSGEGMSNHGASGVYTHGFYLDTWSHVAMTLAYDAGTNVSTLRVYLNGNEVNKNSTTNRSFRNPFTGRPLIIGGLTQSPWPTTDPQDMFGGVLDEARVSNARRSADWINASFHNQKADSSLLRAGNVESVAAWYPNWKYRRRVVIDHEQIGEDLADFPVLVRLSRDTLDFDKTQPEGFDIRFTAADGATPLDYERESYDASRGEAIYWVRLPLVSSSSESGAMWR